MSLLTAPLVVVDRPGIGALMRPAVVVVALAGVVAARWFASRAGLDALAVGATFGLALAILAVAAGVRAKHTSPRRLAQTLTVGVVAGIGLVALAWLGPLSSSATIFAGLGRPAAPFPPWAVIIVLVALAEEAVIRGVLFDRVERLGGVGGAVIVTTVVFALLHVPLYGWHVAPLDLGVGFALGGLRVVTRSVVAPAAAHAVADLATWWL